jgi:DNA-binding transcriptional regulator GbsR (MarR family)
MDKQPVAKTNDDYLEITNPLARRFVADGSNGVFLATLVDDETTLAASSEYHKLSKQRMSYWINKMLDLRLIKVARTERAANGAKQAVYTSVAPRFRIAKSNLTTSEWRETFVLFTRHVWDRVLDSVIHSSRESRADALRVFRDKRTDVCWRVLGKDESAGAADGYLLTWGRVRLNETQYRAMQRDLNALVERYQSMSDSDGKPIWFVTAANEEAPPPKR